MFKIECDNASDLADMMNATIEAKVEARMAHTKLYAEQDKVYDLQRKLNARDQEIERLKAGPVLPNYERVLKDLIVAVKLGNKINGIKVIREVTGMGLKEAKDFFEAAYDGLKVA